MKLKINILLLIITAFFITFDSNGIAASPSFIPVPEGSSNDDYVPAQFPGGQKAMDRWLKKYVKYPKEVEELGIEETITVKFTVTKEGDILYPYIEIGENEQLMEAALEAIDKMPKWKPAKRYGQPVESRVQFEIDFYIQNLGKLEHKINKFD